MLHKVAKVDLIEKVACEQRREADKGTGEHVDMGLERGRMRVREQLPTSS